MSPKIRLEAVSVKSGNFWVVAVVDQWQRTSNNGIGVGFFVPIQVMASTVRIFGKKRIISRGQLEQLRSGKGLGIGQQLRRNTIANKTTSHQTNTPILSNSARIRHSFTDENQSMNENPSESENILQPQNNSMHIDPSIEARDEENIHLNAANSADRFGSNGGRNSHTLDHHDQNNGNVDTPDTEQEPQIGYNQTNTRRVQAAKPKNVEGRGPNKLKIYKDPVFVDVNEDLQPISKSARKLSSLIGVLARDPRKFPLDCKDWRKMEKESKELVWEVVKASFSFPEGREPYHWVMQKLNACWRQYKSDLKVFHFDGKSLADARNGRPKNIPEPTWENLLAFWTSEEGKDRSRRGKENRENSKMCHHVGTKSFARVRAEEEEKGNKTDKLSIWVKTHTPKKGSKIDEVTAAKKKDIETKLAQVEEGENDVARHEIFKDVIGEDKYGYAKTFGMGVKLPRSTSKRCALLEERAKRLNAEEKSQESSEVRKDTG